MLISMSNYFFVILYTKTRVSTTSLSHWGKNEAVLLTPKEAIRQGEKSLNKLLAFLHHFNSKWNENGIIHAMLKKLTYSTVISLSHSYSIMNQPYEHHGYCFNMHLNSVAKLRQLQNCSVVVGDLKIVLIVRDIANMTFPKLKEVTGYLVVYQVYGLSTLKDLIPNLTRVRGNTLFYSYALIVFDIPDLTDISLISLVKVDRGGVIIWGGKHTCNIDTIDWNVIAPNSRHILSKPGKHCSNQCRCTDNLETDKCWNIKNCQIFLEGPDSYNCSSKCFGCRQKAVGQSSDCMLCRHYTYNDTCVSNCPNNTYVLTDSNYCVTNDECTHFGRWVWNNTCVSECPIEFTQWFNSTAGLKTCVSCPNCHKTCASIDIRAIEHIQNAEKCVYVNGSLTIHIWSIPKIADEMRYYLRNIAEVSDYIHIYSSISLISLDFLSSLKRIKGRNLFNGRYSMVVHEMHNLQSLFSSNVTSNLKVDKGTVRFYKNPMLCMHEIKKLKERFPKPPNELDIPQGMNGYSAGCNAVIVNLEIKERNETFAIATFQPLSREVEYTLLYVKIPNDVNSTIVPETCSDYEWFAIHIFDTSKDIVEVPLAKLRPASKYAVCIEQYEPTSRRLSRSSIVKFKTLVGKPEPPFILELVGSLSNAIVIKWVDHLDYKSYIVRYELDVILVDVNDKYLIGKNYCIHKDDEMFDIDFTRQAKVMRPPRNYEKGCESMCGVLSSVTVGAMVDDHFDVCGALDNCNEDSVRPKNVTVNGVVRSLALEVYRTNKTYQVGGLAPFRDYRVRIRACTKEFCSRSAADTVRTLHLETADRAHTISANANISGLISVKWKPPKISNGPVLSYTLEVVSNAVKSNDKLYMIPQKWCVPGNITFLTIKYHNASIYIVRICTTTLAQSYICNNWTKIKSNVISMELVQHQIVWWKSGIVFGIIIFIVSCIVGFKLKNRRSDTIPLFQATYHNRESEPPAVMLSDLMPAYRMSWSELRDLS